MRWKAGTEYRSARLDLAEHSEHLEQRVCDYYASFCCLAQESSKGDDGGHAGTVKEEERSHTL